MGGTATTAPAVGAHRSTYLRGAPARRRGGLHRLPRPPADRRRHRARGRRRHGRCARDRRLHERLRQLGGQVGGYSWSTSGHDERDRGQLREHLLSRRQVHDRPRTRARRRRRAGPGPDGLRLLPPGARRARAPTERHRHEELQATATAGTTARPAISPRAPSTPCTSTAFTSRPTLTCSSCHGTAAVAARTTLGTIDPTSSPRRRRRTPPASPARTRSVRTRST